MKTWKDSISFSSTATPGLDESRVRFVTAGLATLLIILGLESSFPWLKYRMLPWLDTRRGYNIHYNDPKAPVEWDSVSVSRALHNGRVQQMVPTALALYLWHLPGKPR